MYRLNEIRNNESVESDEHMNGDDEEMKSLITTNIHIDELDVFLSTLSDDEDNNVELAKK